MKTLLRGAFLCALALLLADVAQASIQAGDKIKMINGAGTVGGIFGVDNLSQPSEPNFDTFCVELEQYVNFSTNYIVEKIATTQTSGKTLTAMTAWLYNSFLDGTLDGFNGSLATHANALQYGIWKGMGYSDYEIKDVAGKSWRDAARSLFNSMGWEQDFIDSGWTGIGNIRIMNLRTYKYYNGQLVLKDHAQDQLVRCVPEATACLTWSLLASVALVARRRQG